MKEALFAIAFLITASIVFSCIGLAIVGQTRENWNEVRAQAVADSLRDARIELRLKAIMKANYITDPCEEKP